MTIQSPLAAQPLSADAKKVLDFWLQQNTKPFWFAKDEDFDKTVTAKFLVHRTLPGNAARILRKK